jgi:hypothetical protein
MKRLIFLGLAACTTTPVATSTPKPVPASVAPPVAAKIETPAPPPEPIPEGKPGWKTSPKEQNGFWLTLDGLCPMLQISAVGKDVVVSYGGGPEHIYGSDRNRVGHATFMAMRETGIESIDAPSIASPTGITGTSLDNFWIADSTGTRSSAGAVLHWRHNGTWAKFEKDMINIHPWVDGGVMGGKSMALMHGEDIWVDGTKTAPPVDLYKGYVSPFFTSFPTGEVTVFVGPYTGESMSFPEGPIYARQWSTTTKKVTHTPLPMLDPRGRPTFVLGAAPDEIYVGTDLKIAMYDGTSWKLIGKTSKKASSWSSKRVSKGVIWAKLEDGTIEVSGPEGFKPLKTPEKLLAFDGMDKGQTWAVGYSGKLYRRDGEEWIEKPLPLPTFSNGPVPMKAKDVLVLGPDDIVVTAAYWEKGLGWTEQELHWALVRSKKQNETLRCNEPDPENNNIHIGRGFQSWPPMATAECKTPFVMISRRSKQHPPAPRTDWAKIKGALRGHGDLTADGKLIEFQSGDRTFLGAKAKSFDGAKEIATLAAAKDRIRPEVLCAEPPPVVREVPIE